MIGRMNFNMSINNRHKKAVFRQNIKFTNGAFTGYHYRLAFEEGFFRRHDKYAEEFHELFLSFNICKSEHIFEYLRRAMVVVSSQNRFNIGNSMFERNIRAFIFTIMRGCYKWLRHVIFDYLRTFIHFLIL